MLMMPCKSVFTVASKSYGQGKPPFRAYLKKALKHYCWAEKKRRASRREAERVVRRTEDGALFIPTLALNTPSALELLTSEEESTLVWNVVSRSLSPSCREVILLHYYEQLPVALV